MVDSLRLDADWLRVVCSPGTGAQIDLGVPAGSESGTWTLDIYADVRRVAPPLLSKLGSSVGTVQAPVLRFQVSAAEQLALQPDGQVRWRGYWEIYHLDTTAAWQRGDWIINGGLER